MPTSLVGILEQDLGPVLKYYGCVNLVCNTNFLSFVFVINFGTTSKLLDLSSLWFVVGRGLSEFAVSCSSYYDIFGSTLPWTWIRDQKIAS